MSITQAELLDALTVAAQGSEPEDARTVSDLVAEFGMDARRVRAALAVFKASGRLTVHSITREAIDGRKSRLTAFTIRPA